ncbi:hypothetical protein ACCO45_012532 [Purpureocillium lilacinum]|uniref:Uncharacterized protein n=1 Tax=Purpureocillium lilacinum TaxID=33203 RepID=A0ACC4DAG4_PURLI
MPIAAIVRRSAATSTSFRAVYTTASSTFRSVSAQDYHLARPHARFNSRLVGHWLSRPLTSRSRRCLWPWSTTSAFGSSSALARSMAASTASERKARRVGDYPFVLDYRTRWNDNDMYDHMNNSVYNFLYVNLHLAPLQDTGPLTHPSPQLRLGRQRLPHGTLQPAPAQLGAAPLVAHTSTDFFASIAYPAVAEVGVRVAKLGRSSVTYEVAVFERGVDAVRAVGSFVHVFVERATGRPHPEGMAPELRRGWSGCWCVTERCRPRFELLEASFGLCWIGGVGRRRLPSASRLEF